MVELRAARPMQIAGKSSKGDGSELPRSNLGEARMDKRSPENRTPREILAEARFQKALCELLQGNLYADLTTGDRWEFAVEIHVLRRLGLSDNDLRLLLRMRFVEHAREITTIRTNGRKFRPASDLSFAKRTCFVLSPLGIARASCQSQQAVGPESARGPSQSDRPRIDDELPMWDPKQRVLTYGGKVIKQFKRPAVNQELILLAFQEENWPLRILDPLAPHPAQAIKRRLCDAIKSLNQGQVNALIRFHGDGTGEGVAWASAMENRILPADLLAIC
jgi:hypothetical protein